MKKKKYKKFIKVVTFILSITLAWQSFVWANPDILTITTIQPQTIFTEDLENRFTNLLFVKYILKSLEKVEQDVYKQNVFQIEKSMEHIISTLQKNTEKNDDGFRVYYSSLEKDILELNIGICKVRYFNPKLYSLNSFTEEPNKDKCVGEYSIGRYLSKAIFVKDKYLPEDEKVFVGKSEKNVQVIEKHSIEKKNKKTFLKKAAIRTLCLFKEYTFKTGIVILFSVLGLPGSVWAHKFLSKTFNDLIVVPGNWTYANSGENTISGIIEDIYEARGVSYNYSDIQEGIESFLKANPNIKDPDTIIAGQDIFVPKVLLGDNPQQVISELTGNDTTINEQIIDSQNNALYSGRDENSSVIFSVPDSPEEHLYKDVSPLFDGNVGWGEGVSQFIANNELVLGLSLGFIVGVFVGISVYKNRKKINCLWAKTKIFVEDYGFGIVIKYPIFSILQFVDKIINEAIEEGIELFEKVKKKKGRVWAWVFVSGFVSWELTEHFLIPYVVTKQCHPVLGAILSIGITELGISCFLLYRFFMRWKSKKAVKQKETNKTPKQISRGLKDLSSIKKLSFKEKKDKKEIFLSNYKKSMAYLVQYMMEVSAGGDFSNANLGKIGLFIDEDLSNKGGNLIDNETKRIIRVFCSLKENNSALNKFLERLEIIRFKKEEFIKKSKGILPENMIIITKKSNIDIFESVNKQAVVGAFEDDVPFEKSGYVPIIEFLVFLLAKYLQKSELILKKCYQSIPNIKPLSELTSSEYKRIFSDYIKDVIVNVVPNAAFLNANEQIEIRTQMVGIIKCA